jgi:hypothetical protein
VLDLHVNLLVRLHVPEALRGAARLDGLQERPGARVVKAV